ncbi:hypothetical protein [Sutcliffiella horikoshii]|uniref:sunset domain-containing protein n=1 Tax=Sutcliffiella horikoshii TaxID=79883 RepID=UPI001F3AE286|nr:hypothetical protein [Sutcliffiella horikoshii]MCG1022240.1 hypothetical protein [Sutcliffiella horikoshii]
MKNLFKALSFFLVIGSGLVAIFRLNKTNKQLIVRETTSFQVKQTLEAIAATLEKTKENERLSKVEGNQSTLEVTNEEPNLQSSKALETSNEQVEEMDQQEDPPLIKANKNARGEYIYHVPGGVFYNRTTPVEWFHTEEEAQAKGYRKSAR